MLDHIGREAVNADAAPRVRRPIPDTAVIRVDEERCVRCLARRLKEGVDVLWRSAVDPERLEPGPSGLLSGWPHQLASRRSRCSPSRQQKENPRLDLRNLREKFCGDSSLPPVRNRLHRNHVAAGRNELLDARPLGCCDLLVSRAGVVAGVLSAVGPDDTVGADAASDEASAPRALSCALGEFDASRSL